MHLFIKDNQIKKIAVFALIGVLLIIQFANTSFSYAKIKGYDNINKWEEKVVKEGCKKLTYRGRVYYAYQEHVDELLYYLNKKEIDLTEAEALDAIKQLQDPVNAKQGAQQGYLYQIGGKPKKGAISSAAEYDGKIYKEFNKKVRFKNEEEYKKSKLYKKNKRYIERQQSGGYENLAAMREEMREISKADRDYETVLRTRSGIGDIRELGLSNSVALGFLVVEIVLLLITLGLLLKAYKAGSIPMLAKKTRKSKHEQRVKIRKVTSVLLIVITAIQLTVVFTGITYGRTIGSNSYVEKSMEAGGVYQNAYMSFRDDVHKYLAKNKISQNALDIALPYRTFYSDFKNVNRSAMRSGSKDIVVEGVKDSVSTQVKLLAYVVKKDSKQIIKKVDKLYKKAISNETGLFVYNFRNSIGTFFTIGFLLAWIDLLLAAVILLIQRHYTYRGFKDMFKACIIGSFIWGIITAVVSLVFDSTTIKLESDDAYVTIQKAAKGLPLTMLILLGISVVASFMLLAIYKFLKINTR